MYFFSLLNVQMDAGGVGGGGGGGGGIGSLSSVFLFVLCW